MATPFALALALTGSYLLLFVHATLCSLSTQCVESAAPSRALFDDFDDLTMMTVTVTVTMTATMASPTARFIWDPGGIGMSPIDPVAGIDRPPVHASIGWMSPIDPVDRSDRPPAVESLVAFPSSGSSSRLTFSTQDAATTVLPTPSVSIFHYCHPVLSRPTVPNINK